LTAREAETPRQVADQDRREADGDSHPSELLDGRRGEGGCPFFAAAARVGDGVSVADALNDYEKHLALKGTVTRGHGAPRSATAKLGKKMGEGEHRKGCLARGVSRADSWVRGRAPEWRWGVIPTRECDNNTSVVDRKCRQNVRRDVDPFDA